MFTAESKSEYVRTASLRKWLTAMVVLGCLCATGMLLRASFVSFIRRGLKSCQPLEVHLGVTEDPTTMRVTWRTRAESCPTFVRYASTAANLLTDRVTYGVSYKGDSRMLCGGRAAKYDFVLHLHTAVLTGLDPNAPYTYQLPNDNRQFTFTASKPKGDASPFVFFVFGDMGVTIGEEGKNEGPRIVQSAMLDEVREGVPDLMLDVGDISYANGNPHIWESFMDVIEPFASQSLWVVGVGNHEYDMEDNGQLDPWGQPPFQPTWGNMEEGDAHGECGLHVYWRFPYGENYFPVEVHGPERFLPAPPHGSAFPPFYYSFDQGLVHFVTLSTEHDVERGSAQITWLEADLASVDRCLTPFVVVTGHRPLYAPKSNVKDFRTGNGLRPRLEEILIRHRVDVFIAGHIHLYYRLCEAKEGACVRPGEGLVSLAIGTGGHELDPAYREDFDFEEMELMSTWGFGKFVIEDRHLDFSFVQAESGKILDSHTFQDQGLCETAS